jgi:hypothetical protein
MRTRLIAAVTATSVGLAFWWALTEPLPVPPVILLSVPAAILFCAGLIAGRLGAIASPVALLFSLFIGSIIATQLHQAFRPNSPPVSSFGELLVLQLPDLLIPLFAAVVIGGVGGLAGERLLPDTRALPVSRRAKRPMKWQAIECPTIALREPNLDGLEFEIVSRTVPDDNYHGGHFATARVTTVSGGGALATDNVVMELSDLKTLSRFVAHAARNSREERTITLFDDGMTVAIANRDADSWTVTCRPVPVPAAGAAESAFRQVTFVVSRGVLVSVTDQVAEATRVLTRIAPLIS